MAKLERQLGLLSVVAASLGATIGAGIFVLPALAAASTGRSVTLAYLVAAVAVIPAALAKAELATAMSASGGSYTFCDRTYGPMAGAIAGFGLWLSLLFKTSLALLGFGLYLNAVVEVPVMTAALAALAVLVLSNIRGLLKVAQLQLLVVLLAITALAAVIVFGALERQPTPEIAFLAGGADGLVFTAAFVLVAYGGITKVTALADEIKRPQRTVPLGMLCALVIAAALYAGVSYAVVGVPAIAGLEGTERLRPLFALVDSAAGWGFAVGLAAIAMVALVSMANAGLLAAARYPFAMSRDDLLPPVVSVLHRRFVTPTVAITLSAAVAGVALVALDVTDLAELAGALMLALFALVNLAVIVLRETKPAWYQPRFRAPLYPWLQVAGILLAATLLVALGSMALVAVAAMGVPGIAAYLLYGRRQTERRGVVGIRARRRDLLREEPEPPPAAAIVEGHESEVVVALLGEERTPELLIEHAAALAGPGTVKVAALVEIPEQTYVDSLPANPLRDSVERRVQAAAEANHVDLRFESIMSRDVIRTVHELSRVEKCRWLVMEWAGRSRGTLTIGNPLGWLKQHLPCNLFTFHDAGVRYIRRVLVLAEPGPHDALVTTTADQLAITHRAQLTLARYVPHEASDERLDGATEYLKELVAMCETEPDTLLIRGGDHLAAVVQTSASYDLLVIGEDGGASILARLLGTERDRLTARAACSVLRLQAARQEIHRSVPAKKTRRPEVVSLAELLHEGCVAVGLTGSKKELFDLIAKRFAACIEGGDSAAITRAMNDRERSQNTAIGRGVALPHATLDSVDRTYLGVFVAAEALDYGAPDGAAVDVFFATIGPPWERQVHLALLALVARLAKQTALLDGLRGAWDADEALAALRAAAAELDV